MIEFIFSCYQDKVAPRLLELVGFLAERNETLPMDAYVRLAKHRDEGDWAIEFVSNFVRQQIVAYGGWGVPRTFFVGVVQEMSVDEAAALLERVCEEHSPQDCYEWRMCATVFENCPRGRRRLMEAFPVRERPGRSKISHIDTAVDVIFDRHDETRSPEDAEWFPMPVSGDAKDEATMEAVVDEDDAI
jgi:hypothetical protein